MATNFMSTRNTYHRHVVDVTDDDDEYEDDTVSTSSSENNNVHDFDTVRVMRQQEDRIYVKRDPLRRQQQHPPVDIDEVCRNKMCEWSYQIVDFCQFRRESVDVAMNYLDRYLQTTSGLDALQCRHMYQLVAMTCLYCAIKIHERHALSPLVVSQLSRGVYSPTDIMETEAKLLHALQWQMHPPTAFSFVRELISVVPTQYISDFLKGKMLGIAQKQTEFAVADYRFIEVPMSTIAHGAIMNSLECCYVTSDALSIVRGIISSAIDLLHTEDRLVVQTQLMLCAACPTLGVVSPIQSNWIIPHRGWILMR
jgi:Cyclin, N-terminal domain/Cyclin, C-terminal domain